MKVSPGFRVLGLLVLGLSFASPRVEAQSLVFSPGTSANPAFVNTPFTLLIDVTNQSLGIYNGVAVTNVLSPSLQIVNYSPSFGAISNGNTIVLKLFPLLPTGFQQASITVIPTQTGFVTNIVSVVDTNTGTFAGTTSLFVTVTNTTQTFADLAISFTGPAQAIITNDFMTYGITVSNLGPNDAPGVMVTNSLAGTIYLTNSPGNLSRSFIGTNVIFTLGTLTNGAVTNIAVRVKATTAGTLTLSASVGGSGIIDTNNPANNFASSNITVGAYPPGQLVTTLLNPTQQFNPQDGFMEQAIHLSNIGTNAVVSARVIITGLTKTNWLFNAAGTNNGNPFVVYATTLDTNQSVDLLLQFFVATGQTFPFTTNQLHPFAIPLYDLTPPASIGTPISLSRTNVQLNSGGVLLEFDSLTNRTYTIVYSDNMAFSNAMVAIPSVTSGKVNKLQWIDYGPPGTISHPTNTPVRFYQIFLAP